MIFMKCRSGLFPSAVCLLLAAAVLTASGCGGGHKQEIAEARRLLQLGRTQEVIDLLQSVSVPEARYLRAVSFDYLSMRDAALDEIGLAAKADRSNPKYKGFELRLRLHEGRIEIADELIALYQSNLAVAAPALFSFYGYQARAMVQGQQNETAAANASRAAALESLRKAIALNAEIPEFQREMLQLAIHFGLGDAAMTLVERLWAVAPEDPQIGYDRVQTFLLLHRDNEAAAAARTLFHERESSPRVASLYAASMVRAGATPERDKEFAALLARYPDDPEVISKQALYLGRSDRMTQALDVLQRAIDRAKPDMKTMLAYVAVSLPLEAGAGDVAGAQLKRYRDLIEDPSLIDYYEGRLAFLRQDYPLAMQKLARVVERQRETVGGTRVLALEALNWMERILSEQAVDDQLQKATQAVLELGLPGGPTQGTGEAAPPQPGGDAPPAGTSVQPAPAGPPTADDQPPAAGSKAEETAN